MFGPPGHAYVYFTYGMHFCVNLVCLGDQGSASAVLLRAGEIVAGEDRARARRTRGQAVIPSRDLARGPARLCQALAIDRALDGADACVPSSALRTRSGTSSAKILTGPRVGVSRAAEIPWRFWLEGDPTVSVYRPAVPRHPKPVTP
jgi:DNA-3-methyladenine glycosylase